MAPKAGARQPGPNQPADQRMRAARWDPSPPGDQIPDNRRRKAAKITRGVTMAGSMRPVPSVCATVQAEEQEGDEIEEGGPKHRQPRRQHPGGDDGGNGVGGVMQAVEKIEQQRHGDQAEQ
jgi:hypothetical protein